MGRGLSFTIAADFSEVPFSDSYLNTTSNYCCNNDYSVSKVCCIGDTKLFDVPFKTTHLISVHTDKNPLGQIDVSLLNTVPNWINETNSNDEEEIIGDSSHTFGFKFLTDAISEAYQYKNKEKNIITFKTELIK